MSRPRLNSPSATLTRLEIIGALSARLAHALSNHFAIINGNLCVAKALGTDSKETQAAIEAALKGADGAGAILERFVDARRGFMDEPGVTAIPDFAQSLKDWIQTRDTWRLELIAGNFEEGTLAMSWDWLAFVLDTITAQAPSGSGTLEVRFVGANANRLKPWPKKTQPNGSVKFSIEYPAVTSIDWHQIGKNLAQFELAAAYELLCMSGAAPESIQSQPGVARIEFSIPVVPIPSVARV